MIVILIQIHDICIAYTIQFMISNCFRARPPTRGAPGPLCIRPILPTKILDFRGFDSSMISI